MKNINLKLQNLQSKIEKYQFRIKETREFFKSLPKRTKKSLTKNAMDKYNNSQKFTDILVNKAEYTIANVNIEFTSIISDLMSIAIDIDELSLSLTSVSNYHVRKLLMKDKKFKNFCIYALTTGASDINIGTDILSIFFAYVFQNKKITVEKIKHFLSWYIKNTHTIVHTSPLKIEQEAVLNQIITGIKYKKEMNLNSAANKNDYKRKEDKSFSIENITDQFIKIKYISKQEYKHRFHKSPKEHIRVGHFKHYQNGNKVWVSETIINRGIA